MIKNYYIADFETANSKQNILNNNTFVYMWDICSVDNFTHHSGRTLEEFLYFLKKNIPANSVIYFHNIKFDGAFLFYYMLNNKWEKTIRLKKEKQYNCIIDGAGIIYQIKIFLGGKVIEFRDSLKLFQSSVDDIAKSFNLPIKKLSFNYDREDFENLTTEDWQYIKNDTEIVARAIKPLLDFGLNSLTIASSTYKYFLKKHMSFFRSVFPVLDIETDLFIRKAYRGGYCQPNKKYTNKIIDGVKVYDCNSMYPAHLKKMKVPYGIPLKGKGEPPWNSKKIYIIHIKTEFNKTGVPIYFSKDFLNINANYMNYTDNEQIEMYLTDTEYFTLKKHMIFFNTVFIDYLEFNYLYNVFNSFIDLCFDKKRNTTGAERLIYKYMLNSLTGKLALNPRRIAAEPYLDTDKNGVTKVRYKKEAPEYIDPIYTAVTVFITSNARCELIDLICQDENNFIYSDTDSIHCFREPKGLKIGKQIGEWDLEHNNITAKYMHQKCYAYIENGVIQTKIAGLGNVPIKSLDDLHYDAVFNKLKAKKVDGGVVLVDINYILKEKKEDE